MKRKNMIWLRIATTIVAAAGFMAVSSYGSFDPRTAGFYICILQAALLDWLLQRFINYAADKKERKEETRSGSHSL